MRAWKPAPISARSCWRSDLSRWQPRVALGLQLARLAIAVALLPLAIDWRSPLLASQRPLALAVLIALPLVLIAIDAWALRASRRPLRRALSVAVLLAAASSLSARLALEGPFQYACARVLAAGPARLDKLGRHFVVG